MARPPERTGAAAAGLPGHRRLCRRHIHERRKRGPRGTGNSNGCANLGRVGFAGSIADRPCRPRPAIADSAGRQSERSGPIPRSAGPQKRDVEPISPGLGPVVTRKALALLGAGGYFARHLNLAEGFVSAAPRKRQLRGRFFSAAWSRKTSFRRMALEGPSARFETSDQPRDCLPRR